MAQKIYKLFLGKSSEAWHQLSKEKEEFPDIEAQQKHSALLEEFNWGRYLDTLTVLGTEWQ
jgi:hypothetical protein